MDNINKNESDSKSPSNFMGWEISRRVFGDPVVEGPTKHQKEKTGVHLQTTPFK
jgi:hypothetical protein